MLFFKAYFYNELNDEIYYWLSKCSTI